MQASIRQGAGVIVEGSAVLVRELPDAGYIQPILI